MFVSRGSRVVCDGVVFDVPIPLALGHLAKGQRMTVLVFLGVFKTPEGVGVEAAGRVVLLHRGRDPDANRALHQDLRVGKVLGIALLTSPVPVWHAPPVFGGGPLLDFCIVKLMLFLPVVDDNLHVVPDALLRLLVSTQKMIA